MWAQSAKRALWWRSFTKSISLRRAAFSKAVQWSTSSKAAEATVEGYEDELDKYLSLPVEKAIDLDVLAWWKAKDNEKDGLPILAKMARQFLGRPASSLRALSVCSRRRASSMAKTNIAKRMGPSSTASLPPPTPSRDERARMSGARDEERQRGNATRGVTGVSGVSSRISPSMFG